MEENSLHLSPLFKEVRDLEKKSALTFKNKKGKDVKKVLGEVLKKEKYCRCDQ